MNRLHVVLLTTSAVFLVAAFAPSGLQLTTSAAVAWCAWRAGRAHRSSLRRWLSRRTRSDLAAAAALGFALVVWLVGR